MVAGGLLASGSAEASVYCVGTAGSDCKFGYAATAAGLQSAIDDADVNADFSGGGDTVRVASGTYARAGGFKTAGGDISIVGAGEGTVLETTGAANDAALGLAPGGTTADSVSKLRVDVVGSFANGINGFRNVSDVHVGGPGTVGDSALRLPADARVSRVLVDPAKVYGPGGRLVLASSGVIEDTVVHMRSGASAGYTFALDTGALSGTTADLTLRHVTVVGDGTARSVGVFAQASRSAAGPTTENVHVRDTVVHGVDIPLDREGVAHDVSPPCSGTCYDGVANLDYRYSSLAPAKDVSTGPGATTAGAGNLGDPDPLFTADFHPGPGSPLIDAGDPAAPQLGDSPTDAAGNPRIAGGRRDIGAFEFTPTTPGPGPGPQPGSGIDVTAPAISRLSLSRRRFRVGRGRTPVSARAARTPRGTVIRFTLSEPATVALRVYARRPGRRVVRGGRSVCARPARRHARTSGKRCWRYVRVVVLTRSSGAGPRRVAFSGRVGAGALHPGRYRLTVAGTDAAGNRGKSRARSFVVVR